MRFENGHSLFTTTPSCQVGGRRTVQYDEVLDLQLSRIEILLDPPTVQAIREQMITRGGRATSHCPDYAST